MAANNKSRRIAALLGGVLVASAASAQDVSRSAAQTASPTVSEAGVPGFEAITWHGIVVPSRTPQPAIARLNGELNKLLQSADMRQRLAALGSDPIGGEPKELTDYIRSEIPRLAKVIKDSGAKPE